MSKTYKVHELIYKYIMDYDEKGEQIVKNIFGKIIRSPEFSSLRVSSDYFEDIYSEFYQDKLLHSQFD